MDKLCQGKKDKKHNIDEGTQVKEKFVLKKNLVNCDSVTTLCKEDTRIKYIRN